MCLEAVPPKEGWQIFTFLIRTPRSGQGDGFCYVDDDNDDDVVDDNDNVDVDGDDDDVQAARITNGGQRRRRLCCCSCLFKVCLTSYFTISA